MNKRRNGIFIMYLLFLYLCESSTKEKNKGKAQKEKKVIEDYTDTLEDDGTYEQETEAELFYEDAMKSALQILWQQRHQISMANFQLIHILGWNSTEMKKYRKELHIIRDIIDQRSDQIREKLTKKLTLSEMTEPIEKPTFEKLTSTWKDVKGVFDVHQPQNLTYEFEQLYKWIGNIENETSTAYRKVNWLMARIRKMKPVKL